MRANPGDWVGFWRVALGQALQVPLRRLARGPERPTWSARFELLARAMRADSSRVASRPLDWRRAYLERLARRWAQPRGVAMREVADGRVRGVWFEPARVDPQTPLLVYFHGGAYRFGSPQTHAALIAGIAHGGRARAFALRYRLAPEHPFPAALEDAVCAVRWLRAQGHTQLVLAGDSAGGNLVLATMLCLRDVGEPMPLRAALLCPWVELADEYPSRRANAPYDSVDPDELVGWARDYAAGHDPRDPLISPARADLGGLPRLLVQVGSAEMLRDEVHAFVARARAEGVDVWLSEYRDMIHDWQLLASMGVPEAAHAVNELSVFLRGEWA